MNSKEIYYIANYRLPTERAHGLQVAMMTEAFAKRGVALTLIAPKRWNTKKDFFSFYSIERIFKLRYLPTLDLTGIVPVIGFFIQSLSFALTALIFIKINKFKGTVYSRDQFFLYLCTLLLPNKAVYEIHTMPDAIMKHHRKLFRRIDTIIAISGGLKKGLIEMGIRAEKIIVAHDGYDPDYFENMPQRTYGRSKTGLPENKKLALYIGSLMKKKGIYTLVDAAKSLSDDYSVVIVGGTIKEFASLKREVGEGVKNVILYPRCEHSRVIQYIASADVLILPNSAEDTMSREYTSPLKFFEYLASKKPIIASDVPALREIGEAFEGITYVATDNPKILAQAIMSMRSDVVFERDMTNFTWEARAKSILTMIMYNLDK